MRALIRCWFDSLEPHLIKFRQPIIWICCNDNSRTESMGRAFGHPTGDPCGIDSRILNAFRGSPMEDTIA